jgi:hypothetical protein
MGKTTHGPTFIGEFLKFFGKIYEPLVRKCARKVRYRGNTGTDLVVVSLTAFGRTRTLVPARPADCRLAEAQKSPPVVTSNSAQIPTYPTDLPTKWC